MKRLIQDNGLNSPEEYDKIFFERQMKGADWADLRRWKTLLRYYKDDTGIIDLGCLDSRIPEFIQYPNGWYLGVDEAIKAIQAMNGQPAYKNKGMFRVGDIYDLPEDFKERFAYAVLGEVLEHLDRPQDAIREAFRILKPGGVFAISTPLEEENEPGALDKDRHIWSFSIADIETMVLPYAKDVKIKILRSKYFPVYKYCWPQIIVWAWKK